MDRSSGRKTDRPPHRHHFHAWAFVLFAAILVLVLVLTWRSAQAADPALRIPVLTYHRVEPVVSDEMIVTPATLRQQLAQIRDGGWRVIGTRDLVAIHAGQRTAPSPRSVVITVDDDHRSVYTALFPVIREFGLPVTLFVYPSAVSNAGYAMTWEQLAEMRRSGLVDVQSHTYWHPNFKVERQRLGPEAYQQLVRNQLASSRTTLERRVGAPVDLLAWPFGLYDEELTGLARAAGYVAAFSIERRPVTAADNVMALPRYIVVEQDRGARFDRLLAGPGEGPAGAGRAP